MPRRFVLPPTAPCLLTLLFAAGGCTTVTPVDTGGDNTNGNSGLIADDNGNTPAPIENNNAPDPTVNNNDNTNDNAPGNTSAPLDSDGDGFSDIDERTAIPGSDPFNPEDTPLNPIDSDGDGCSDFDELNFIGFCDADPNTPDTPPNTDPIVVDNPDAAFTFSLSVARHVDVNFTDAQIDDKLAQAGAVLQSVEFECPDVATDTTFMREGATTTFTAGGASITAETQLDDVFALPQDIKIVDMMVGVCGIPAGDNLSVVLGCATSAGSLVITTIAEPDVWAHEWGHVQNLLHRDDCPRNVMHSFEVATNAVNAEERAAFLTPTPAFGLPHVAGPASDAPSIAALAKTAAESLPQWLSRLATARYLTGVPAAAVKNMHPDAVEPLMQMLASPEFTGRRRNVARMLGFTHDPRPCEPLTQLITTAAGELSFDEFAALTESFLALGRLSRFDAAGHVLNWLIDGTDAQVWPLRGVDWTYRAQRGASRFDLLARLSVLALGLTDQPAALDHLRALQTALEQDADTASPLRAQVDEAIARLDPAATAPRSAEPPPIRQP